MTCQFSGVRAMSRMSFINHISLSVPCEIKKQLFSDVCLMLYVTNESY